MLCPELERGENGRGSHTGPGGPNGSSKAENRNLGRGATNALGNVLAVMTPRGWAEPEQELGRALTPAENLQVLADMRTALAIGEAGRSLDMELRRGKGTDELLANADERKALLKPAVDYYGVICGSSTDDDDPVF